MSKLEFKDLSFTEENSLIKVNFLKIFFFYLERQSLENISKFTIKRNAIIFKDISYDKAQKMFNRLLIKGINNLKNSLNNNKTIYIHKNSGIPLMGGLCFGIVDKGTNMIEVKPITNCNINCIFCSVDEGKSSKKLVDYVVEKDYLVEELEKLVKFKGKKVNIYINPHGEPLLYSDIVELVKDLSSIENINIISIITNGTLLTKTLANRLIKAGLNQINVSLNAINPKTANLLAGDNYNIENIKEILKYISKHINVVLSPVLIKGLNESEIPKLIEFSKSINCKLLIQNFQSNKRGRNPSKPLDFDDFYSLLRSYEKQHSIKLISKEKPTLTEEYFLPFKKGDIIKTNNSILGRYPNQRLAICGNRLITINNCYKHKNLRIKITKSIHNIFLGELV